MPRFRPRTVAALVLTAAAAGVALAWDWNWFKPTVERHLADRSGRTVRIGDLDISWEHFPHPTVHLRQLAIDNAPWVRATRGQPFVAAGDVALTFDVLSVLREQRVVTLLHLVDADVALERSRDDQRNWRLRDPDDRGPGRFKILRLQAERSRLRFVHEGIDLDLRSAATPLPAPDGPRVTHLAFDGTWRGLPFAVRADSGPRLTFLDTGEAFPVRGEAVSGPLRLALDGQLADVFRVDGIDARVTVSGGSFADLRPWMPAAWPHTAAFKAAGHVTKAGDHWTFADVAATVGRSDIGGTATYHGASEPPYLEARLASRTTHLADVWQQGSDAGARDAAPLRRFDADVTLRVGALHLPHVPPLSDVRATARLDGGVLDLSPLHARLAGGEVQGRASWDAREAVPTARAGVTWRNLRLEQLLPPLPGDGEVTGPLSGELQLTSRGSSLPALLDQASGQGEAMVRGGKLSAELDAKLGLDGGRLLGATLVDRADVAILCARASVVVKDGRGELAPVLLDTARTRVDGRGTLDLGKRAGELLLTPRRKSTALLALDRSLRVAATAEGVDVKLVPQQAMPEAPCDAPAGVKAR